MADSVSTGTNARARWRARAPSLVAGIALLLAIAPFVVLARYAHPAYDDWCIAEKARTLGFWGAEKFWYTHWAGRFTAIALWNVVPISTASLEGYRAFPPTFLAGFLLGLFWLGYEMLRGVVSPARIAGFAVVVFAVYLYAMASPAEGFYWYDGATVTTSGVIFGLLAVAAAVRSQRTSPRVGAYAWATVAGVFAALAGGSNEIVLLLVGFVLLVLLWLSRRYGRPRWHLWAVPLFFTACAGVVDVLAPGNYKRAAVSGGLKRVVGPLVGSAASSGAAVLDWLSRGPIIIGVTVVVLAGIAASPRVAADSPWRKTSWLFPIAVSALGVWGVFFLTHWASGFTFKPGPPDRVINVALVFFMLVLIPAAFMFGVQVLDRYQTVVSDLAPARPWVMVLLSATLFGTGNVRLAYMDLLSGRAAAYDRELSARHEMLRAASHRGQDVVVAPLSRIPKTILFKDITDDPQHPHNGCYAAFWDVPSVRVTR